MGWTLSRCVHFATIPWIFCLIAFFSVFHFTAIQQLEFLEGRKKQYLKATLQAKQRNDMEQAKTLFRTAKGFDPMIEAARSGKSVDISKVRGQNTASTT